MPKLTEEQLNAIKSLPYYTNVKDLIPLYESGVLSQDKFNEEILKARENYKAKPFSSGMEMVLVEGGTFDMGCNEYDVEKPVHSVTVGDFYIGKTEVTQAQWKAVMGNNPSCFKGFNLPVETVSWFDTIEFCNKLSEKEGLTKCYSEKGDNVICNFKANGYRLPTKEEWEYAARGGNQSRGYEYSGSNNIDEVAWHRENSGEKPHQVATKQPNELGIYDMSGNMDEWCWDTYFEIDRALRGGSWFTCGYECRVSYLHANSPVLSCYLYGFRIARTK
jgi:formylglycine-generating enzyme required for sulfatase activity